MAQGPGRRNRGFLYPTVPLGQGVRRGFQLIVLLPGALLLFCKKAPVQPVSAKGLGCLVCCSWKRWSLGTSRGLMFRSAPLE